jgi:anhydro-N-acetylmuramic acid kinase
MTAESFTITGMMSGTSLDGMDLVLCRFRFEAGKWHYRIIKAETIDYPDIWENRLTHAAGLGTLDFLQLHNDYGVYIGEQVKRFVASDHVDLVASHGHTIFHQPERKLTFQLGSGAAISATCRITTVSDFRTRDVALGGQGAPLVPVGDEYLFEDYAFCLNLGGFANISNKKDGIRIACDLCPVNIVANELALRAGHEFDRDGAMGRSGNLNMDLVSELNALDFYNLTGPRSLGREWVETVVRPITDQYDLPVPDLLRSVYEHMAFQISRYINAFEPGNVLVTGGGAFNIFFIELLRQKSLSKLVLPDEKVVKYKEALIFAFLGLLRSLDRINCLASVTGASGDSSSGVIYKV